MRAYYNIATNRLVMRPGFGQDLTGFRLKRGDAVTLELEAYIDEVKSKLPEGAELTFGIKKAYSDVEFHAAALTWTKDAEDVYTATFDTNTQKVLDEFDGSGEPVTFLGEFSWKPSGSDDPTSSQTIEVVIVPDVVRGNEGTPLVLPGPEDWLRSRAVRHDEDQSEDILPSARRQARLNIEAVEGINGGVVDLGDVTFGSSQFGKQCRGLISGTWTLPSTSGIHGTRMVLSADPGVTMTMAGATLEHFDGTPVTAIDEDDGLLLVEAQYARWRVVGGRYLRADGTGSADYGEFRANTGTAGIDDANDFTDRQRLLGQPASPSAPDAMNLEMTDDRITKRSLGFLSDQPLRILDLFIRGSSTSGDIGDLGWISNGSGTVDYLEGHLPLGRRLRLQSGSTAGDRISLLSKSTVASGGENETALTVELNPSSNSWASDGAFRMGFTQTSVYDSAGHYIYLSVDPDDGPNWMLKGIMRNAHTFFSIDTGLAAASNNRQVRVTLVGSGFNRDHLGAASGSGWRVIIQQLDAGGGIGTSVDVNISDPDMGILYNPRICIESLERTGVDQDLRLDFIEFHQLHRSFIGDIDFPLNL